MQPAGGCDGFGDGHRLSPSMEIVGMRSVEGTIKHLCVLHDLDLDDSLRATHALQEASGALHLCNLRHQNTTPTDTNENRPE
jgi:hypothetical protein